MAYSLRADRPNKRAAFWGGIRADLSARYQMVVFTVFVNTSML